MSDFSGHLSVPLETTETLIDLQLPFLQAMKL